jgi:hypothetical protein
MARRSFSRAKCSKSATVDGRLYVSRKAKKPDEWDRPIPAYDPYGPGTGVAGDDDFVAGDETGVAGDV